jgi:phosphotriesterase-related protein
MKDAGKVITVKGPVDPERLGVTLMHEHLLRTVLTWFSVSEERDLAVGAYEPIRHENASWLRQYPYNNRETCITTDWRASATELRRFKLEGGRTLVDLTTIGLGRDVWGIRKIADDVGMNIVAGSGYYVAQTHPWDMDDRTVDELSEEMITDIRDGVDGTGIRCGILGEIGTSDPVTVNEWKVVEAAANAHHETGAAISIHALHELRLGPSILERLITEYRVKPSRLVMCHVDLMIEDWGYTKALLDSGAFIEYDHFGRSGAPERIPSDDDRIAAIERLIGEDRVQQLVISQDLGNRAHMAAVGGCGYNHIVSSVIPQMRARGISIATIKEILIENPRRILPLALSVSK